MILQAESDLLLHLSILPSKNTDLYCSLQIDFSSLVDVRIIKHGNLDVANAVSGTVNETPVSDKDTVQDSTPNGNSKEKKDVPLPGIYTL